MANVSNSVRKACNSGMFAARQELLAFGPALTTTEVLKERLLSPKCVLTKCADDPAGPFWMVKVNDEVPPGVLNALY